MTKHGIVYVIRNLINEKAYVGITSGNPKKRWNSHVRDASNNKRGYLLHSAIAKYGVDNFSFKVVASAILYADLLATEATIILQEKTFIYDKEGWGYNMTRGGRGAGGFQWSQETKDKLSKAHKGKPKSAEHIAAMRGLKRSPEGRANMRVPKKKTPKGHKWTESQYIQFKGVARTAEFCAKMKQAAIKYKKPIVCPYGRFDSLTEASIAIGVSISTIGDRLRQNKTGWYYETGAP